jgi:hypothetical protein
MAILGVNDLKAALTGGGARANMFEINISFPAGVNKPEDRVTTALCKSAQLPASTVGGIEVPFRGRVANFAGDRTFEPWTTTFINDTNFSIRNAIEEWMNLINSHEANVGAVQPLAYQRQMFVKQLDRNGAEIKKYTFHNAYPTQLDAIDLSYDNTNAIEEFGCTWTYDYWVSSTTT